MSYILDALRRADAERERGAVPGLHAQSLAPLPPAAAPGARAVRLGAAGAAGALLLLGALALFWWLRGPQQPAQERATATDAPAPAPAPAPASTAPATAATNIASSGAVAAAPTGTRAAAVAPIAVPVPVPLPVTTPTPTATATPAAKPARGAGPAPLPGLPASSSALIGAGEAPRPTVVTAPDGARPPVERPAAVAPPGAPRMAVGGAIYAEVAANRMLLLNGQIFHEGERPAADLVLEQIGPKSAVLNYRGTRYEIRY